MECWKEQLSDTTVTLSQCIECIEFYGLEPYIWNFLGKYIPEFLEGDLKFEIYKHTNSTQL